MHAVDILEIDLETPHSAPNGKGGDVSITQFHTTKRQGREFARWSKAGEWNFGNSVLGGEAGGGAEDRQSEISFYQ